MQEPLISVIVPIYKVEDYLDKCVESILAQTYKNLEVWLVDDGSPDRCGPMCDEWAKKDARIKVIHKPNGGLSDARNVAIDVATGEWIACIDSDDYVVEDYIETLLKLAVGNGAKCSVVQPALFHEGEEPEKSKNESFEVMDRLDAISAMFYQTKLDTSAWGKLYHRSLFKTGIRYPKGLLFEDNPTTYRLMYLCDKVAVSQKKLYNYLLRANSIEGADFTPVKLDQGLEILGLLQQYPEITNQVEKAHKCKLASLAFHFIMKMPVNYTRKNELWKYVKNNRFGVILDGNARMKTRVGCALSYLGIPLMKKVFALVSNREQTKS